MGYPPDVVADVVIHDIVSYVRSVDAQRVGDYIVWVEAQEAAEAARAAQEAAQRMPATAPQAVRTGAGHSDAWWRGVAQCEQGGRNDPYFGYFSFMDGSQGGRSWEDQVAAGNALLSHVPERESQHGAWADSCIDAGYAASPGG